MTDPVTDSVTLNQALQFAGTADIGLLEHAITRVAPGLPNFDDPGVDGAAWDAVKDDVRQHVQWHVDPARYTEHALPWRERENHEGFEFGRSLRLRGVKMPGKKVEWSEFRDKHGIPAKCECGASMVVTIDRSDSWRAQCLSPRCQKKYSGAISERVK